MNIEEQERTTYWYELYLIDTFNKAAVDKFNNKTQETTQFDHNIMRHILQDDSLTTLLKEVMKNNDLKIVNDYVLQLTLIQNLKANEIRTKIETKIEIEIDFMKLLERNNKQSLHIILELIELYDTENIKSIITKLDNIIQSQLQEKLNIVRDSNGNIDIANENITNEEYKQAIKLLMSEHLRQIKVIQNATKYNYGYMFKRDSFELNKGEIAFIKYYKSIGNYWEFFKKTTFWTFMIPAAIIALFVFFIIPRIIIAPYTITKYLSQNIRLPPKEIINKATNITNDNIPLLDEIFAKNISNQKQLVIELEIFMAEDVNNTPKIHEAIYDKLSEKELFNYYIITRKKTNNDFDISIISKSLNHENFMNLIDFISINDKFETDINTCARESSSCDNGKTFDLFRTLELLATQPEDKRNDIQGFFNKIGETNFNGEQKTTIKDNLLILAEKWGYTKELQMKAEKAVAAIATSQAEEAAAVNAANSEEEDDIREEIVGEGEGLEEPAAGEAAPAEEGAPEVEAAAGEGEGAAATSAAGAEDEDENYEDDFEDEDEEAPAGAAPAGAAPAGAAPITILQSLKTRNKHNDENAKSTAEALVNANNELNKEKKAAEEAAILTAIAESVQRVNKATEHARKAVEVAENELKAAKTADINQANTAINKFRVADAKAARAGTVSSAALARYATLNSAFEKGTAYKHEVDDAKTKSNETYAQFEDLKKKKQIAEIEQSNLAFRNLNTIFLKEIIVEAKKAEEAAAKIIAEAEEIKKSENEQVKLEAQSRKDTEMNSARVLEALAISKLGNLRANIRSFPMADNKRTQLEENLQISEEQKLNNIMQEAGEVVSEAERVIKKAQSAVKEAISETRRKIFQTNKGGSIQNYDYNLSSRSIDRLQNVGIFNIVKFLRLGYYNNSSEKETIESLIFKDYLITIIISIVLHSLRLNKLSIGVLVDQILSMGMYYKYKNEKFLLLPYYLPFV